jgi:hypothetical protein
MRLRAKLSLLFVLLLALAFASSVHAECYAYAGSSPFDYGLEQGGYECVGTGSGCRQCIDYNQNRSGKSCTYDWWGYALSCYYWGPDYQT